MAVFTTIVEEEGQHLLGWRDVPTNNDGLGESALVVEPHMQHVFIARGRDIGDEDDFERKLYVIRKRFEKAIVRLDLLRQRILLLPQPFVPDAGLQGHAHGFADAVVLPGPVEPAPDQRDVHVPLALQHEHVPELGAGPSVPDDLA